MSLPSDLPPFALHEVVGATDSTLSLLQRIRAGDREALDVLVQRCLPHLLRWAKGRLPRHGRGMHETSDIVQDALLKSLGRLGSFEPQREGSLQAYLRRAVLNRIRDEYRATSRRPMFEVVQDDSARALDPSPLEAVIGHENVERYERALARLDDVDRELIIARLEWGYSYQEVAVALERPSADAARQAVRRAVARLAQEMSRDA